MIGTIINVILLLIGTSIGLLIGKGIPSRIRTTVMHGLGLCVILIGAKGALGINGNTIESVDTLCVIICIALGCVIGSALDIEKHLDNLGKRIEQRFASGANGSVSRAFVTTSLLYCVGAMAIVGSIDSGIRGDHSTLIAKGIIDGISSIFFASTLGWGVALSALAVLVYQGSISLLSGFIAPLLTAEIITHMSAVGGLLIIGVGLNVIRDQHLPVGNMIPAIFLPILYIPMTTLFH